MTDDEEMAETAAKLGSAMDSSEGQTRSETNTEADAADATTFAESLQHGLRDGLAESLGDGTADSTGSGLGEQFGRLLGEMVIRTLSERIRRMQDIDDSDLDPTDVLEREVDGESLSDTIGDSVLSGMKDDIEDGQSVIEETDELLETVDVSDLAEAVDVSELPSAIDAEEVPAAIANADPKRAVELRRLASLVEFDELWDAVDVRAFMQNKDELEDAADDMTGGDEGDDDEGDSGMLDSVTSSDSADSEDGPGMLESMGSSGSAEGNEGSFVGQEEAMQAAIQSKLRDAIGEFRESALDARDQLKDARDEAQETVDEKTGGGTGQPSSRNPTAYSTMVSGWKAGGWSSATFSTVPRTTRHSSAPGHFRIYGRRFDDAEAGEGDDE